MKRFGPKFLTIEQVTNDYFSVIDSTHNIPQGMKEPTDPSLKEISLDMSEVLMILGLEGLHFLDKVLRSQSVCGLTPSDCWDVYCLCDGFGRLSPKDLSLINDGWDWSHVRDSSPEALKEAETLAKQKVIDIYNKYKG